MVIKSVVLLFFIAFNDGSYYNPKPEYYDSQELCIEQVTHKLESLEFAKVKRFRVQCHDIVPEVNED